MGLPSVSQSLRSARACGQPEPALLRMLMRACRAYFTSLQEAKAVFKDALGRLL